MSGKKEGIKIKEQTHSGNNMRSNNEMRKSKREFGAETGLPREKATALWQCRRELIKDRGTSDHPGIWEGIGESGVAPGRGQGHQKYTSKRKKGSEEEKQSRKVVCAIDNKPFTGKKNIQKNELGNSKNMASRAWRKSKGNILLTLKGVRR